MLPPVSEFKEVRRRRQRNPSSRGYVGNRSRPVEVRKRKSLANRGEALKVRGVSELAFKLAVHGARNSYQAGSQQAQRSRFGNTGYDVGIAARNEGRPVEEASTGVNRQLRRGAKYGNSVEPSAGHRASECVAVGSIANIDERPGYRSGEGAIEKRATRKARGANASDDKAAATVERAAHLQVAAR